MCNVFEVAKKICEAGNWEVTNLQLQKMLYIAQVLYIGQSDTNHHLFRANFEAWDYGPVAPMVYHQFKIFGSKPIQAWAFPTTENDCSDEENAFIDAIAKLLVQMKPSRLVSLTHREGTGWYKNYSPGAIGQRISEEDMLDEFREVWLPNAKKN